MADFGRRTVSTTRHEYVLDSPTNWGEMCKAAAVAIQEMPVRLRDFDDTLLVEAGDDEVVIYWEDEGE